MKVLIVDDERQLVDALAFILKKNKITCDCAYDGEEAYEYARTGLYDVILLDWMLPVMDGITVLKKLRDNGVSTPVIMLTAKSDVADIISGLNVGADDDITKPFDSNELLARIKAVTRRKGEYVGNCLTFGDLVLDCDSHKISVGNSSSALGAKEFQILEMLMRNSLVIQSKEQIIEKIWGFDSDVEYNNVEVYISFIRKKLTSLNSSVTIKSVRGTGYRLESISD